VEFQAASHSLGKMQGSGKERITESDTVFITEVATRGTHRGKVAKSFRDNTRRSRSDLLTNIGCLDKMTRLLLAKPTRELVTITVLFVLFFHGNPDRGRVRHSGLASAQSIRD